MAKKEPDLALLSERFLGFLAYELEDQARFNKWIEDIMANREHNPGALSLLQMLLNKTLPTPQALRVTSGEEGFKLVVEHRHAPTAPETIEGEFQLRIEES